MVELLLRFCLFDGIVLVSNFLSVVIDIGFGKKGFSW